MSNWSWCQDVNSSVDPHDGVLVDTMGLGTDRWVGRGDVLGRLSYITSAKA